MARVKGNLWEGLEEQLNKWEDYQQIAKTSHSNWKSLFHGRKAPRMPPISTSLWQTPNPGLHKPRTKAMNIFREGTIPRPETIKWEPERHQTVQQGSCLTNSWVSAALKDCEKYIQLELTLTQGYPWKVAALRINKGPYKAMDVRYKALDLDSNGKGGSW